MDFEEFKNKLRDCRYCECFGIAPKPFVGKEKSEKSAKIVQVSQQPSRSASASSIPFSDQSGRKLITKWYQIERKAFDNPKLFYITGMAHCYDPDDHIAKQLQKTCSKKWLDQELSFLDPRLYIIIGKSAADFFFPDRDFTELVFQNHEYKNRSALVLPHPSPRSMWPAMNPKFESERLKDVRKAIHEAIAS